MKTTTPDAAEKGKKWKQQSSWKTTDDYEIELRRQRMLAEPMQVRPVGERRGRFRDYVVCRCDQDHALEYVVELRSLTENINTCSCPDFAKNFLGTCKHIERVKAAQKGVGALESPYVELYMERSPWRPVLRYAGRGELPAICRRYVKVNGELKEPAATTLLALQQDLASADAATRAMVRVSSEIEAYLQSERLKTQQAHWRLAYEERFKENQGQLPMLRCPLYDYQIAGTLHLAFKGRALLADEMGLGKTVQAIAAAAIQQECLGVKRVLVVTPASLKCEWEDQIRQFTALPLEIVYGLRKARLDAYRHSQAFFLIVNYEQVLKDVAEINEYFHPDLVILDEAQRIKNWKTLTANHLKRLQSRFAFVLTGTPLENRIDELYSLVEFVDPTLLGSLFRFNRRFYAFDDSGKVCGMQNLRELHALVQPVMLRRRKDEIKEDLPERVDNNYFVKMTSEQSKRYDDYADQVTRLAAKARRYPLTPDEFKQLQLALSCMRMLCDSVYILDPKVRESPKVLELQGILKDIWEAEPDRKVLIFSEWTRMLELVQEALATADVEYALHTGALDQQRRRDEIRRFKNDPACRVMLSSDSGSVGLNLQAASVVINLDLPWNPARHEQRIARAWRKHQRNRVHVINLVSEATLEQRMLVTLNYKRALSDAVLDGRGDFADFEQESSRTAFMERLSTIMSGTPGVQSPDTSVAAEAPPAAVEALSPFAQLSTELSLDEDVASLCQAAYDRETGQLQSVLAVAPPRKAPAVLAAVAKTHGKDSAESRTAILSPDDYALLQKLLKLGIVTLNPELKTAFATPAASAPRPSDREQRMQLSALPLAAAERHLRMARVLRDSGFADECRAPALQAVLQAGAALFVQVCDALPETAPKDFSMEMLPSLQKARPVAGQLLALLPLCLKSPEDLGEDFAECAEAFLAATMDFINRRGLAGGN